MADFIKDNLGEITYVDVRPVSYYEKGHIPTSVNIPFDVISSEDGDFAENWVKAFESNGITPSDKVIIGCQTGYHSKLVCDALSDEGFTDILYYPGSFEDWITNDGYPVEK